MGVVEQLQQLHIATLPSCGANVRRPLCSECTEHTGTGRERERERARERERERDRKTERQRDREIERHRHRQAGTQTDTDTDTHTQTQTQIERHAGMHARTCTQGDSERTSVGDT
jgi:hypothetical protein